MRRRTPIALRGPHLADLVEAGAQRGVSRLRLAGSVDYRRPPWRTDRTCSSWGGGTAGAVVADDCGGGDRRHRPGCRPGLWPGRAGGWPEELLDARRPPELHDWGYAAPGADGRLAFDRAKVIGGCSSHNGCAQSWGWRGDYDRWGSTGCAGWSANEVLPSFHRATERMRVRRYEPEEIQPFQAVHRCRGVGRVSRTDDLDDLDGGAGVAVEPVNAVDGSAGTRPSPT